MTRRWENTSHLLILYDTPVDCPALFLLGNKEGMKGLHGVSERLEVAVYKKVVHFYFQFYKNADSITFYKLLSSKSSDYIRDFLN